MSRAIESDWYESIKDIDRPNGIGVLIIKNYINVEFPVLPIGTKVWDSTNKAWWEKVALCDQGTSFHQWKIGKNEVGFISDRKIYTYQCFSRHHCPIQTKKIN